MVTRLKVDLETRVERLRRIRAGLRTLGRQDLPTPAMFPSPDHDLLHQRIFGRHYFVARAPHHVEHVFIEGHDRYRKAVHYRLLATVTGTGLLTNEGEPWAAQRRLIQPIFAKRHLDQLLPHMVAATTDFLDRWQPDTAPATTDIASAMTEVTLDVVGRALFGSSLADAAERLRPAVALGMDAAMVAARLQMLLGLPGRLVDVVGDTVHRTALPGPLGRIHHAMRAIDDIVNGIIDRRVAGGTIDDTDLLGLLLATRDDDGTVMSRQQVRDELVTMMLAGHETTANGLSWFWHLLSRHPDVRAGVVDEVDALLAGGDPDAATVEQLTFTRAAFQEALRLYPPAWVLEREALVDDELDGQRVPKGATIIFPVHLIHRDPRWWPDAETFDPTRFLPGAPTPPRGTYLPFGAGRRTCVGANFALTEGVVIAAMLTQRFRFDAATDHEVTPSATVTLRPRRGLPMVVSARAATVPRGRAERTPSRR